jgi:hypothetical protein
LSLAQIQQFSVRSVAKKTTSDSLSLVQVQVQQFSVRSAKMKPTSDSLSLAKTLYLTDLSM